MSWRMRSSNPEPHTSLSSSHTRPTFFTELLRTLRFWHTTAPTPDNLASPLFLLPPELREHIYRFALLSSNTSLSLITTSSQLKMEAQPLLYQRPIKLSSQAKMFEWIRSSQPQNLERVKNLSLQLSDIDLSPLLNQDAINDHPNLSAWTLYNQETHNLDAAFYQLPNLQELSIYPPRIIHSQLLRRMYTSLLALIPRHYPNLRRLIIHDDSAILEAVTALQSLPKVVFKEPPRRRGTSCSSERSSMSPKTGSPRRRERERSPRVKRECDYEECGTAFLDLEDVRVRLARSYVAP